MFKNCVVFLAFVICYLNVGAQNDTVSNTYIPKDLNTIEAYLSEINTDYIKTIDGQYASKIKKVYKNRDEKVIKSINDSCYIFSPEIEKPLQNILQNIYIVNPEIDPSNYRFFINNSFVPNASCYGDGMFEINLGLFNTFTSDDEIASVICHEIAHKLLSHSLQNVSNWIAQFNSKETKQKVRDVKRQRYGQTRAALSVIDELKIDILDYSKEIEAQADSLGFILYSKTRYQQNKALSALEKLKVEDDMLLDHNVKVDSVFNFETYPFKAYWLKETTSIFDTTEKIDEFKLDSDTLKTHPEIEFRVEKLSRNFGIVKTEGIGTKDQINLIQQISHHKAIQSAIDRKFLDFAIYLLIEKFQNDHISEAYYYTTMALVLKQIYEVKASHKLGKFVPPKNNFSDEKHLNTIRLFLHNLELKETRKMGLAFCLMHQNTLNLSSAGTAVYEFFNTINN
ncbi:MAG: M48 family metalloprotease [Psychroserpens sp.]|uniref:M48 family metalloprotease n=1 Tax=Psychroserpens sp. TaxID=2020870 RepID=UPI003C899552